MKTAYGFCVGLFMVVLFLFYPVNGFALDNQLWSSGITFHFTPPGARSLGMGGAFVAMADDATAAVANPAGLAQLTRTQVAVEGRFITGYDKNKAFNFSSTQDGMGSFRTASSIDSIEDVAFAAFTTPVFNNFFNLSIYYDRPMDFASSSSDHLQTNLAGGTTLRFNNLADFKLDEVGLSLAKSFLDGKVMIGGGFGVQFLLFDRTTTQDLSQGGSTANSIQSNNNNEVAVSGRAGILVRPIDNLRLGFNATINPKFDTDLSNFTSISGQPKIPNFVTPETFKVPDNYSFGAAYNVLPNWALIFEGRYVMYSQLKKDFQISGYGIENPNTSQFSLDDICELHFGTEYVIGKIQNIPVALRAGFFYEPAHD